MKKKFLALSLLATTMLIGTTLVSCGNGEPVNEDKKDEVTGIVVSGNQTVKVGESINLVVDVLGTDDDSVTWSSSDTSIATVDTNGKVTGVAIGQVTITATSVADPNFKYDYTIRVTGEQATEISILIEATDGISQNEDGSYNIPGGKTFKVSYKLNDSSTAIPNSFAYSFSYLNGTQASASDCIIETQEDGTALVTFNSFFSGGVISLKASYSTSVAPDMEDAVVVNSIDQNAENAANLASIVENLNKTEVSSLTGGKLVKESGNTKEEITYNVYDGASYSLSTITSGEETSTVSSYSTVDLTHNAFYYFNYDASTKAIPEGGMIVNETFIDEKKESYETNASLPHFIVDDLPQYGFTSLLNSITTGQTYQSNVAFGYFVTRGNTVYTFGKNQASLVSEYLNDLDYNNKFTLTIDYDSTSNQLKGYTYQVEEKPSTDTNYEVVYKETASDLTYGTKGADNSGIIDISDYYIQDFKIEYVENYAQLATGDENADNSRYEYDDLTSDENGIDIYSLSYDKSLPLRISNFTPSTASTLFDIASVSVTNSVTGERQIYIYKDGIVAINAPKNNEGNFFATQETVTITTRGGATHQVKINWTAAISSSIKFDSPNDDNVEKTKVFKSIRLYQETEYFWLNTDNDDTSYTFGMRVTSGDASGINFVQHNDNNKDYPNGTYTIEGLKVGTYQFYFYVNENEDLKTETYTLTVSDPISAQTYKDNLVGKTFEYSSDTTKYSLFVESDTNMKLTMPTSEGDRGEGQDVGEIGTVTVNIPYTISDGRVTISSNKIETSEGVEYKYWVFENAGNSYYDAVYSEDIEISEDFRNLTLSLRLRSDSTSTSNYYNFGDVTFVQPSDVSELEGKSFKADAQIYGEKNCTLTISFGANGKGTINIKHGYDDVNVADMTFDYTVDAEAKSVSLSNVVSTYNKVEGFAYEGSSMRDENTLILNFSTPTPFGYNMDSTFQIDLRTPIA